MNDDPALAAAIGTLEELASRSTGDVVALVAAARGTSPAFTDDERLARAFESAARRRAAAGDRTATWWAACAIATLCPSPFGSPQDDAEILAARFLGELPRSAAAAAPLPTAARWLVAAAAEPAAIPATLALARKNAATYLDRLDAELAGRSAALAARWNDAPSPETRAAIDDVLVSYARALATTRAGIARVVDRLLAHGAEASVAREGERAIAEIDDAPLRARIEEVRRAVGGTVAVRAGEELGRPSFAGAAPPAFERAAPASRGAGQVRPAADAPDPNAKSASVDELDAAMRAAFERAWNTPSPETRAAFEAAVRARYALETASIPDAAARQQALDHYVAHALAQLPT
jgi:hypothetical protein